jgi:hypothetical protein
VTIRSSTTPHGTIDNPQVPPPPLFSPLSLPLVISISTSSSFVFALQSVRFPTGMKHDPSLLVLPAPAGALYKNWKLSLVFRYDVHVGYGVVVIDTSNDNHIFELQLICDISFFLSFLEMVAYPCQARRSRKATSITFFFSRAWLKLQRTIDQRSR